MRRAIHNRFTRLYGASLGCVPSCFVDLFRPVAENYARANSKLDNNMNLSSLAAEPKLKIAELML